VTLESEFLASLVRQAGNHLWQSTAFAAAAFLLTLALKATHARARHWVWLGASMKFLVPFALLAQLGNILGSWLIPAAPAARIPLAVEQIVRPFAWPAQVGPAVAMSPAGTAVFPLPAVLFAVWLVGFVAVFFHWWNQWRGIRAAVRASLPLREGREVDALRRLRSNGRLNLPSVELVSSAAKLEPGIFGILKPVLWLPAGIADCLSEKELDAILAHELCHARRRDNLTAATHMAVEAVFWFHPLVWWLGARLVEERERACDEEVVLLSDEPQAYAEGILKVCEFYVASPLTCAAGVTGADLRKRIEGIMASRFIGELCFWKRLLLAGLLAAAVICPFVSGVFKAGAQTRKLEFEVASIKPAAVPDFSTARRLGTPIRNGPRIYGDRAEYISMLLRYLIAEAYQVRSFQVVFPPGGAPRERFDVVCKMPAGSRKEDAPLMLQSLLAERFKLAVHRGVREQDVWALVVGKSGPKFRESTSEAPQKPGDTKGESPEGAGPPVLKGKDGSTVISGMYGTTFVRTTLDHASSTTHTEARRMTMPYLADLVSRTTFASDREVVDMTGLKGSYDVVYDMPFSATNPGAKTAGVPDANGQGPRPAEAASDPGSVSVLRAMRRLGLDLEKRKAQVDQVIVDHVEKTPTEN
jgi:bla regulator protein blaR1